MEHFLPLYMPPYSPQLNSIENIWGTLKYHVRLKLLEKSDHKHSKEEFEQIATECCDDVFRRCAFNVVRANYGFIQHMLESMKASIVDGVDSAEEAADLDAQNLTSKTADRPPSVSKMAVISHYEVEQPVSRPTSKAEEVVKDSAASRLL